MDCGVAGSWSDRDNNRERSQITVKKKWRYGAKVWIGFSVYLPREFQTGTKVRTTVGKIRQKKKGGEGNSPTSKAGRLKSFLPVMQMEMEGNRCCMSMYTLSGSVDGVSDK